MKPSCIIACLLLLLLPRTAQQAHAQGSAKGPASTTAPDDAISVVVGPSAKELEPVAVPMLLCPGVEEKSCKLLTSVLRNDLLLTGIFRVVDPESYIAKAVEPGSAIPFPDWFNVGARFLATGVIKPGKRAPKVSLQLYDVVDRKPISIKVRKRKAASRDAILSVHDHVNAMLKAISGRDGVLGTPIVFVRKESGTKKIMRIRFGDPRPSVAIGDGAINLFPSFAKGGKLLYTSFRGGKPDLYLGDRLLTEDEYHYRSGRMSPNGKHLVVSVDRGDGQSDIWLYDSKGRPLQNHTDSEEDEVQPRWSRSGVWIAYVSNRTGRPQIYAMRKDGSDKRRVSMAGEYNTSPEFGPKGLITFSGMDMFVNDLFVTDLAGNMQRITQLQGSNKDPSFSPDGRYIVFVTTRNRKTQLFVAAEDGRWQYPVFSAPGDYSTPTWGR